MEKKFFPKVDLQATMNQTDLNGLLLSVASHQGDQDEIHANDEGPTSARVLSYNWDHSYSRCWNAWIWLILAVAAMFPFLFEYAYFHWAWFYNSCQFFVNPEIWIDGFVEILCGFALALLLVVRDPPRLTPAGQLIWWDVFLDFLVL